MWTEQKRRTFTGNVVDMRMRERDFLIIIITTEETQKFIPLSSTLYSTIPVDSNGVTIQDRGLVELLQEDRGRSEC